MPKITKHVPVRRGFETVWLKPGDDLPDWAEGMVGDHALDAEVAAEPTADESSQSPDADADSDKDTGGQADPAAEPAPDFTKPAPAKRSRARKAE